jgi:hypothetical protein
VVKLIFKMKKLRIYVEYFATQGEQVGDRPFIISDSFKKKREAPQYFGRFEGGIKCAL